MYYTWQIAPPDIHPAGFFLAAKGASVTDLFVARQKYHRLVRA
jgi:hypothetical protein